MSFLQGTITFDVFPRGFDDGESYDSSDDNDDDGDHDHDDQQTLSGGIAFGGAIGSNWT